MQRKFAVLALILGLPLATMQAQPRIQAVEGTSFAFGDVYNGTNVSHDITIKSTGSDTLAIHNVSAQCGCTATLMQQKKLAPGSTSRLTITFNTGSYAGNVTKHVYVVSNDPKQPQMTIEFTANVISVLNANPGFFSFDESKVDSTYTKSIVLSNPGKDPVKILGVDTKFSQVRLSIMKNELMPGENTLLQATYHPTKPGTYNGAIVIRTNHAAKPITELRVLSTVVAK